MRKFAPVIYVLLLTLVFSGCAKNTIPNTEVPDTQENRDIIDICERYRKAIEEKNIGLIMSLASPRYFDNSGTTTGDDDYDRAGLEEVLKERFAAVKTIRYEFKYRDVYEIDTVIYVEYTYTMSFQYEVEGEMRWANRTADNRIELESVEHGYLIVAGM